MRQTQRLTARQEQVLTFFEDRQRQTGFIPTLEEAADHFGFKSPNSVRQHLALIEKKGFVRRVPGRSRGLVIGRTNGQENPDSVCIPLLGRIPAGYPVFSDENTEALLTLPTDMFRGNQLFALRVQGTSMKDAGILDGDVAVLDATPNVRDGAIAAVRIEDEATLKRVYREPKGLLLKADNPEFRDIRLTGSHAERARVIGVLVGVVRKL